MTRALIGLTEHDIYVPSMGWEWTFGYYRQQERAAVISSARMRIRFGNQDPQFLQTRLRKMTTRYIGFLHYQLRPSPDERSVLYRALYSYQALDNIGDDF